MGKIGYEPVVWRLEIDKTAVIHAIALHGVVCVTVVCVAFLFLVMMVLCLLRVIGGIIHIHLKNLVDVV